MRMIKALFKEKKLDITTQKISCGKINKSEKEVEGKEKGFMTNVTVLMTWDAIIVGAEVGILKKENMT